LFWLSATHIQLGGSSWEKVTTRLKQPLVNASPRLLHVREQAQQQGPSFSVFWDSWALGLWGQLPEPSSERSGAARQEAPGAVADSVQATFLVELP
jgi:hypothetical protein